ncbi:MAG TPA: c-type cytochrome, partial [Gemmatales bacterium]|nr:c-type cytochrome [Gemmatales bacterium]
PAFRPIDVKMGPDGAIYIADWYNPIIQHGEVDFRDPRRDVTHGRIWRVTAKGRPLVKKPKIEGATTAELLEALKQPEQWTRDMARVAILKQGNEGVSKILLEYSEQESASEKRRGDAQWDYTIEAVAERNRLSYELGIIALLTTNNQSDPNIKHYAKWVPSPKLDRRNKSSTESYFRLLSIADQMDWIVGSKSNDLSDIKQWTKSFANYVEHDSPRVRLEILRLLAKQNDPNALPIAMNVLNKPMDRFLDYALWLTVRELEPKWLPAFREGKLKFDDPKHLLFAVQASGSPELVEPLLKYLQQNDLKGETADALWNQVAQLGGPKELQILWEQCLDSNLSDDQRLKRLQALEVAASQRKVRPHGDVVSVKELISSNKVQFVHSAIRLCGLWDVESLRGSINELATKENTSIDLRTAAFDALTEFILTDKSKNRRKLEMAESSESKTKLKEIFESEKVIRGASLNNKQKAIQIEALQRVVRFDPYGGALGIVILMNEAKEGDLSRVLPPLLQTKNGAPLLVQALEASHANIPPDVAKTAIRIARSTGQVHQPLIDALAKAGKLNTAKWEATPVVMKDLLEGVAKDGNAARGELIYRRKELNCLKCHGIGGSGGQIGPDMTSIGASAQPDYLIESLLLPSKAIKENFNTTVISTVDGKVLTGIKQRENKDELILRDAEGADVKIPIKDIEGRADGKSLMPEGLVDGLTRGELVDLVRFLTELGKVGNYSVGTTRVARTWETLVPNAAANEAIMRNRLAGAVMMPKGLIWSSEYATVGGLLPLDTILDVYVRKKGEWSGIDTQIGFARTKLEVGTAGEVQLSLNDAKGMQMWLDQQPLEPAKEMTMKLSPGTHVLTLAVNKKERTEGVRVELKDVAGSAAQGRWVLGR